MASKNTMNPVAAQAPVANTDAVLTMAAPTNSECWNIYSLSWSYSAAPTGGEIVIAWTDPVLGALTMVFWISNGGPGQLGWDDNPLRFPPNAAVTATLKAGSGSVLGTIYGDCRTHA